LTGSTTAGSRSRLVRRDRRRPRAAVLLAVAALTSTVVGIDAGRLATDTRADLHLDPTGLLRASLSAWVSSPYAGSPNYGTGLAPVAALVALLQGAGMPGWLVVRLLHLALGVVAGAGAARLWRRLSGRPAGGASLAVAVAYVANPYVLVLGAALPILLPYCVLPWLVLVLLRALGSTGWRGPAAAALVFAAMGGENAGVVPTLLLAVVLPCLLFDARRRGQLSWGQLAGATARVGALCLAVSAYWLVPALLALGAGTAVTGTTETLASIASSSSFEEVLRGLGTWPLYGRDARGAFQPYATGYVTDGLLVLATAVLPVTAVAAAGTGPRRVRPLLVAMVVLSAVVMVGLFPYPHPSAAGRLLGAAFDHVPGTIAYRTTVKAGGVLLLGLVLLAGNGAAAVLDRLRSWPSRALATAGAVAVALTAVAPAFTGALYPAPLDIPAYWRQAAADLSATATGRVLFLPGQVQAAYRWRGDAPDDVVGALLRGPRALVRTTVPATTPAADNLLADLDARLEEGTLPPGALSTLARYLGVSDIVLRADMDWQTAVGTRPSLLLDEIGADPGLRPVSSYGSPGQNTTAPGDTGAGADRDRALPPLLRYAVTDPRGDVRAEPTAGQLLVDGDGAALAASARVGLLAGDPAVRLIGATTAAQFRQALSDGARVVLTDTDRRAAADTHRLVGGSGPLLPAAAGGATRQLFDDPDLQTVATSAGGASVTATSSGTVFGPVPEHGPALAVDGDPATSWLAGDFGNAVGQALTVHLGRARVVRTLTLQAASTGGLRLRQVEVRTDAGTVGVTLPTPAPVTILLPTGPTSSITVRLRGTGGSGLNAVGLADLRLDGAAFPTIARLPLGLQHLADGLDAAGRTLLAAAPLDIVLRRASEGGEEQALDRLLTLPDARVLSAGGTVSGGPAMTERQADDLAGVQPAVTATSSSRAGGLLAVRGSQAFDHDRLTSWVPAGPAAGAWVQASFPKRRVSSVVIRQPGSRSTHPRVVTRISVSRDGGPPVVAEVGGGSTVVPLPPRRAGTLRVTILAAGPGSDPLRVESVDVRGVSTAPTVPPQRRCTSAAEIDGVPLRMRLAGPLDGLLRGGSVPVVACGGAAMRLAAGVHQVTGDPGVRLDDLHLSTGAATKAAAPAPVVTTRSSTETRLALTVAAATAPYYLVTGQAFDGRWRASLDGRPLGSPVLLDGHAVGWRIADLRAHHMVVTYPPQTRLEQAYALSIGAVVGSAGLLTARRGRPLTPGRTRAAPPAGAPSRRRRWARWVSLVVVSSVLGGPAAGLAAAAAAACYLLRPPAPSTVLLLAAGLVAGSVLAFIVGQGGSTVVQPVGGALWPHRLAAAGLVLLVVGAGHRGRGDPG